MVALDFVLEVGQLIAVVMDEIQTIMAAGIDEKIKSSKLLIMS